MVHFEGAPKSQMKAEEAPVRRMTIAERFQKRLDENRGNAMEVPSPIASSPEDDRLSAMIKGVNEKTAARAANRRDAMEVPSPIGPEAGEPVSEQSAEEKERADRLEYARLYLENAMRIQEKMRVEQGRIAEERAKLMSLPAAPKPSNPILRSVERPPEPMPTVDSQKVYESDYGPLMILSVDSETRTMYFATPAERRRVDAALVKDEGQSSLGAADFTQVVALSPDQARKFLNRSPEAATRDMAMEVPSPIPLRGWAEEQPSRIPQDPRHLQNRYRQMTG